MIPPHCTQEINTRVHSNEICMVTITVLLPKCGGLFELEKQQYKLCKHLVFLFRIIVFVGLWTYSGSAQRSGLEYGIFSSKAQGLYSNIELP